MDKASDILKRVRRIELRAKHLATENFAGQYQSCLLYTSRVSGRQEGVVGIGDRGGIHRGKQATVVKLGHAGGGALLHLFQQE